MSNGIRVSAKTRANWLIDAAVLLGGIVAAISGIYFLYLPSGGFKGGRNPMYGVQILFGRHTWEDLHTWGGVAMIVAAAIHLAIHGQWLKMMSKRVVNAMRSKGSKVSRGAKWNVAIDALVAVSFLVCALSGVYFLLVPSGGLQGGANTAWDAGFLFSRTTWDLLHTWSGTTLIAAVVVHLAIHWRWVKNVTVRFFLSLVPASPAARDTVRGELHAAVTGPPLQQGDGGTV
jgi:hypothetical protein